MKISFECDCILLQKTLLLFCQEFIAYNSECDFIVSDRRLNTQKPLFLIGESGSHLALPFTKKALVENLKEFYSAIQVKGVKESKKGDFNAELDLILANFKADLVELFKRHS
ncbi:hypothetical protein [Campylobacter gastrosuis]|uniref:Ornithine carbamoyltransferase n=1 Tax=Campylobacter gastrosuis TaxID=2974576 RepID=A0ABT7HPK9_9BACT|nr:hypothetical protein [Campylobacter gastrosuis]MDL0088373.1 hypothetical protein [Campylobacter gastrosuis]